MADDCIFCKINAGEIPSEILEALQALSERTGITVSEHVRRAIDEYLKRNKAPAPRPAASSEKAH